MEEYQNTLRLYEEDYYFVRLNLYLQKSFLIKLPWVV